MVLTTVEHHFHAGRHGVNARLDGLKGLLVGKRVIRVPPAKMTISAVQSTAGCTVEDRTDVIIMRPCYETMRTTNKSGDNKEIEGSTYADYTNGDSSIAGADFDSLDGHCAYRVWSVACREQSKQVDGRAQSR